MNVQVDYEAPDVYSLARMIALIDDAVADTPDGLVVSFPEPGLAPAIRRAVKAGIPVVTINSGSDAFRSLGVLAHVGQPEGRAGLAAGRRLARAGVRRALCVNQQVGNIGLDARCAGLARAMRAAGGTLARARRRRPERGHARAGSPAPSSPAGSTASSPPTPPAACRRSRASARPARGRVQIGAFDLGPDTLRAVRGGQAAVRRRPAALPPGLPAGGHARQPRPLRAAAGAGRRGRDGRELRHARRTPPRRSSSASARSADDTRRVTCHTPLSARGGTRTHTPLRAALFKSAASASSATRAGPYGS